jgi:hypothetical protein
MTDPRVATATAENRVVAAPAENCTALTEPERRTLVIPAEGTASDTIAWRNPENW